METALYLSSSYGHLPIVEFLISKGANIEAGYYYSFFFT
jgi:ankyrin repeat protein